MNRTLAILVAVTLAGSAHATSKDVSTYWTGDILRTTCTVKGNTTFENSCADYIAGVSDAIVAAQGGHWLCAKPRRPEFVQTVVDYMGTHTNEMNDSAAKIVRRALAAKYGECAH